MASFSTSDDCRSYNKVHRKLYFLIIKLYLQPTARPQLPRSFDMQLSCINISEYQDTFRYMHKYIHIYILSYLQIYISAIWFGFVNLRSASCRGRRRWRWTDRGRYNERPCKSMRKTSLPMFTHKPKSLTKI